MPAAIDEIGTRGVNREEEHVSGSGITGILSQPYGLLRTCCKGKSKNKDKKDEVFHGIGHQ